MVVRHADQLNIPGLLVNGAFWLTGAIPLMGPGPSGLLRRFGPTFRFGRCSLGAQSFFAQPKMPLPGKPLPNRLPLRVLASALGAGSSFGAGSP